MSFLNKVENVYLTILRLVVLTGATLALISAIILGGAAASKLLSTEPKNTNPVLVTPENSPKLDAFMASKNPAAQMPKEAKKPKESEGETKNTDIDASVKNISQYIREVLQGDVETSKLHAFIMEKASKLPNKFENAYLKSLNEFSAELLKKIPSQKTIVAAAQTAGQKPNNAIGFINLDEALQWHLVQFAKIIDENNAVIEQKQQQYVLDKAAGTQEMYIAAGSFATFLLVVFLFIIIKIERNLRVTSVIKES